MTHFISNTISMNMKNIIVSLFIFSLAFGTAGFVSAHEGGEPHTHANTEVRTGGALPIDIKAFADIEATFKAERARCDAMKNDAEKRSCYEKIAANLKAKFTNVDERLFRDILQGGASGHIGDDKNNKQNDRGQNNDKNENGKKFSVDFSGRFDHTIKKLTAVQDRLSKVADRIDSRMEKLKADNIDTSASVKLVASARAELKLAADAITNAQSSFKTENEASAEVNANNYKTTYAKTLAHVKTAKEHLVQAHRNLVQAISSLKPGANKIDATGKLDVKVR